MSQPNKPDDSNEPEPIILPKVAPDFEPEGPISKDDPVKEPDIHERTAAKEAPRPPFAAIDEKRGG
jgi:hypothetical protein